SLCLDDPILDGKGNPTYMYRLAGEFCPEAQVRAVSLLDFPRERVGSNYSVRDDIFTMEHIKNMGDAAKCTLHKAPEVPVVPVPFDPFDETWPKDDPKFNILDPTTWPDVGPEEPGVTQPPLVTPDPDTSTNPGGEAVTPPEEPYIPAN
ncbi:MAG: hypothetical protein RRY53_06660, partial [Pseudoflavonifractor sp.]